MTPGEPFGDHTPRGYPLQRGRLGGGTRDQAVHSRRMDPLDPGRARLDGLRCAVCDGSVPPDAVQTLAWREGLTFAQIACDACSSSTLAILVDGSGLEAPVMDARAPDGDVEEPGGAERVTSDDVLDMHLLLRTWQGGLRELVTDPSPTEPSSTP